MRKEWKFPGLYKVQPKTSTNDKELLELVELEVRETLNNYEFPGDEIVRVDYY